MNVNNMKKITLENGKTIEISDESYKALSEGIQSKKPWRAEHGEKYWYAAAGEADWHYEGADSYDDYHHLTGSYFQTEEQALAHLARQEAIGRVTHRIYELNDGWEPDWSDGEQPKYCIEYGNKSFTSDHEYGYNPMPILPYMATEEIADQIISEMEDDLKIIWGV